MKNLFDPGMAEDVKQRVLRLDAASERQWGSMTLPQTLAHCTSGLQMAMGTIQPKRASFPASLIGPLIKPLVFGDDKPMRRNSPSSPELFAADAAPRDLERERAELIAAIDTFAGRGAGCCTQNPHPFFGRMKPQEWAILMYKHLDHHLRQFGG
ncbi:MAG TPA: DUF1569 domain-containing protein [Acidobacteriaceae bacterium]|nr:DUF1569 domain-containing protein [Acidobacteriaceae bacterium]